MEESFIYTNIYILFVIIHLKFHELHEIVNCPRKFFLFFGKIDEGKKENTRTHIT